MSWFEQVVLGEKYEVPTKARFEENMMRAFAQKYQMSLPMVEGRISTHPWHVGAM